ncbi:sensor histidine kinase [Algibacter pectinivorans]|uniref:histidine kinase n=1 Tax=Algibacter pectinivorans TaxID=870482 RepID=A0A1I1P3L0_9FLAO|nr:ATP-binding protein [Algibacter pectinivorans]SFD04407.1 His Kinase A (phospho-acceptor) domain-containing protein [Algibacter pectinivorans]
MNSLLKRQIRKYLTEELRNNSELTTFLSAVDSSYNNFDEQSKMIQRAMAISSEELFTANRKLQKEADEQKEVIEKLKGVIDTLKFYNLKEEEQAEDIELTGANLVDFIDNKTKAIITMNKQRQSILNELAHQNQELSDYAHMVSHDLKSPLRSIDTLTAWLAQDYQETFDDSGKKTLNLIRTNVEKMDTLISGILEYSTIGKNQLEVYDVDLNIIIDDILNSVEVPEHITIKKSNLPTVKGDKYRLQQLFQNLIGNAIKYNDKAKGVIEIGVEDCNTYWQFYIKDNGKGIEETYFDKIFKTFEKLENTPGSSGIGLSIVKKIVELYNGKIWVESKITEGSTFFFTIKK